MLHNQLDFVIPENLGIAELVSLLQNNFTVRVLAETVNNRSFYDTFDWRLYKNASVLELHDDGRSHKIYWRAGKDAKLKIQSGLKKVPRLANHLPACEFHQQLQSVISVRELTPRIKIRINRQPLAVLDKNEKVVVRINFDKYWCNPSRMRAGKLLGKRLSIKAVKGYPKAYQQVKAFFQEMKLHPAQDNMMKLALAIKGESAGEYTTKLNLRLDPDLSAEETFKEILLRLHEIMRQNTSGSINGRDTEFMHDYHDTIQKIRCALNQISDVLPPAESTKYNEFFSKLGELTSPVRNLDVFLLQLENYQENMEQSERQQLQPFGEYLLHSRAEAQKKFIESLKSSQYRENIKLWSEYLERPGADNLPPDNPVKVADELIWDVYQQTLKQGKAISRNGKAEALHELHKSFKRMCYLMEFFLSFYPVGKMRVLIQLITELEKDLDNFDELNFHLGIAKEFVNQSMNVDAIKACEQMITILQQQQQNTIESFKHHYSTYSASATKKQFNDMFIDYHKG